MWSEYVNLRSLSVPDSNNKKYNLSLRKGTYVFLFYQCDECLFLVCIQKLILIWTILQDQNVLRDNKHQWKTWCLFSVIICEGNNNDTSTLRHSWLDTTWVTACRVSRRYRCIYDLQPSKLSNYTGNPSTGIVFCSIDGDFGAWVAVSQRLT